MMEPTSVKWTVYAVVLALVLACAAFDWRMRRIPNALTLPAIGAGLLLYALSDGWGGLAFSAKGMALGAGVFFVPYYFGGMGAGDVKLMGAVGALLGWPMTLVALFYTALAGGLCAVFAMVRARAVGSSFTRMGAMFQLLLANKRFPAADTIGGRSVTIPYALPVALGTIASIVLKWPLS
jgi:prepilin peptidase CpaA